MRKLVLLSMVTFIVAFCSLVYELILGQTLSAFFGNTVLRYSVTIGFYMLAMGFGAMFAEGKFVERPSLNFMRTELALTVLGGFIVVIFFLLSFVSGTNALFFFVAHALIIIIGVLTGFEIPLLFEMARRAVNGRDVDAYILGVDYAGAFIGALVFAFIFYPRLGLVSAAFLTGSLNALSALVIYFYSKRSNVMKNVPTKIVLFQGALFGILILLLFYSGPINEFLIEKYIS